LFKKKEFLPFVLKLSSLCDMKKCTTQKTSFKMCMVSVGIAKGLILPVVCACVKLYSQGCEKKLDNYIFGGYLGEHV
jgi:hypothetical protein